MQQQGVQQVQEHTPAGQWQWRLHHGRGWEMPCGCPAWLRCCLPQAHLVPTMLLQAQQQQQLQQEQQEEEEEEEQQQGLQQA